VQLRCGLSLLPKLVGLHLHGYFQAGLYLESPSLTSLRIGGAKGFNLSGVACPRLVDVHLVGHDQIYKAGPVIMKDCPWLEQREDLQSAHLEALHHDNGNLDWGRVPAGYSSLWTIKWVDSKVVNGLKASSPNFYFRDTPYSDIE
jgi:hypothetical protein